MRSGFGDADIFPFLITFMLGAYPGQGSGHLVAYPFGRAYRKHAGQIQSTCHSS